MDYKLAELLDVPKLQELFDSFDKLHQLPSAVIDIKGNILTATNWQDICIKFHRANPQSEKECIKSDTHLVSELSKGKTQVEYKCPHGLVDTATPIVVEGKHLGNAFTGQFFLEPPDEEHFRKIAKQYGFNEEPYIEAMRKVPIITEDKHRINLEVMAQLTKILAEMGLKQKRQIEVEQALYESRESFKNLVEFTDAVHWEFDLKKDMFTYVSPQATKITGYEPEEWNDLDSWANMIHPEDKEWAVDYCLTQTKTCSDHDFTYRIETKNREVKWLRDIVKVISLANVPQKLIGVMFDITNLKEALNVKEVLLKEVHHRVKNNMAVISSLLALQAGYVDEKKYLDMFNESQNRIRSMALVHEKLYMSEDFAEIDVKGYVASLAENIRSSYLIENRDVKLNINVEEVNLDIDNLVPCGLLMNEIVTNAFKHAFGGIENPEIIISMKKIEDNNISLSISDNGIGLPDGYDISKSTGLGHKLIKPLTKQIEGTMEVIVGNGTEFKFIFPETLKIARAE